MSAGKMNGELLRLAVEDLPEPERFSPQEVALACDAAPARRGLVKRPLRSPWFDRTRKHPRRSAAAAAFTTPRDDTASASDS